MTEATCRAHDLACTCSYQSDSAPTEQQSRLSWSRESVHVSMQCVCMSMNMIVVHGFYPFVVRQATPQPRRRFDDLSRLIDGLWHLQTGTTNGQASVHKASEGRFGGFKAAPFGCRLTLKAWPSSISRDRICAAIRNSGEHRGDRSQSGRGLGGLAWAFT